MPDAVISADQDSLTLYQRDFALWAEQQGRLLRQRTHAQLDWQNLAEEVESLGRSQAHEIRTRMVRIVEHLLKQEFSPAQEPRRGWQDTIEEQRVAIESLLETSPSLRERLPEFLDWARSRAVRSTLRSFAQWSEPAAAETVTRHGSRYSVDDVLAFGLAAGPAKPKRGGRAAEPG